MSSETLAAIRQKIQERGAEWRAGFTTVSGLPRSAKSRMLGLALGPQAVLKRRFLFQAESLQYYRPSFPQRFNWRNHQGYNWVSPVKNQGECGSCVAFACAAVLECLLTVSTRNSHSLSEAFLFFCGGGDCDAGWDIEPALQFIQQQGVTDKSCFLYLIPATQQPCSRRCADWRGRLHRITSSQAIASSDFAKHWISNNGPMVAAMDVYDDFTYYAGGVYSHVFGDKVGEHAVAVVGYDDPSSYWICKNSWGTGWGEDGFFRIRYGECGICVQYTMWGMEGPILP